MGCDPSLFKPLFSCLCCAVHLIPVTLERRRIRSENPTGRVLGTSSSTDFLKIRPDLTRAEISRSRFFIFLTLKIRLRMVLLFGRFTRDPRNLTIQWFLRYDTLYDYNSFIGDSKNGSCKPPFFQ